MDAKEYIRLELYAMNIKYDWLIDYKQRHSRLLSKVNNMIDDGENIKSIKKVVKDSINNLYTKTIVANIGDLVAETYSMIGVNDKYDTEEVFVMGLSLDEMINSRMNTHFKDIVSQAVGGKLAINKTKKRNNNVAVGMCDDYLKVCRQDAMQIIEDRSIDLIGWLYSSILDRRTTKLCISLNNRFYSKETHKDRGSLPRIPNVSTHVRCRSMLIPIYDEVEKKKFKGITLDEFILEDKTEAIKMIGKTKYKLLEDNKLKARDIFDYKNRKFFTLKEIKSNLNI